MAASSAVSYQDPQQICDYVLLRHASVGKDAESEKIHKVQSNVLTVRLVWRCRQGW